MTDHIESHEFHVRVEFDVEVTNPSHIDAAFAGAEFLENVATSKRFEKLVYQTRHHGEERWCETDLEDVTQQRYWWTDIEPDKRDSMPYGDDTVGIVDDVAGGIIAYVHRTNAVRIIQSLTTEEQP